MEDKRQRNIFNGLKKITANLEFDTQESIF